MKRYYREVMELSRLNEMLLEHFQEAILHVRRRDRIKPLTGRFQAVNGYLEAIRKDVFRRYPFALLEVFLLLQQHPDLEGVRASTIRLIRANRHRIDDGFRADIRARSLFLEILRQPPGHQPRAASDAPLRNSRRLPARLRPGGRSDAVRPVPRLHRRRAQPVRVRNLRMFADPARYHELPHCADIFARLPKPELIYIAGLFHDIAKGRNADHSELGSDLVREFCAVHGFSEYDTELVAWLVRHHLLMSITAQRRDISDPAVVSGFAETVGDHVHLDYLYLLTIADIRGTDPALWNDWKDALLHDLLPSDGARADPRAPQPDRAGRARAGNPGGGRRAGGGGRSRYPAGRDVVGQFRRRLLPAPFRGRDPLAHLGTSSTRAPPTSRSSWSAPGAEAPRSSSTRRTGSSCSPRAPPSWGGWGSRCSIPGSSPGTMG